MADAPLAADHVDEPVQLDRALVLIVEDNLDDERLTIRALGQTDAKPRVEVARDGEQAISYLATLKGQALGLPSLVLLDLKLPKLSGFDVLRALRASKVTKDIPVVILTSSDDPSDIQAAWDLGANDYLRKPVDYAGFLAAVGSVVRMWLPGTND